MNTTTCSAFRLVEGEGQATSVDNSKTFQNEQYCIIKASATVPWSGDAYDAGIPAAMWLACRNYGDIARTFNGALTIEEQNQLVAINQKLYQFMQKKAAPQKASVLFNVL